MPEESFLFKLAFLPKSSSIYSESPWGDTDNNWRLVMSQRNKEKFLNGVRNLATLPARIEEFLQPATWSELFKDLAIKFGLVVGWTLIGGLAVYHMSPGKIAARIVVLVMLCFLIVFGAMLLFSVFRIWHKLFRISFPVDTKG